MSDYVSELRRDLVEAAARQQQLGPAARLTRPLRPRAWSPATALGVAAALVAVVVLVAGLRAVSPPRPPAKLKLEATYTIGGQPRDAVAAAGALVIADLGGSVVRVSPADPRERNQLAAAGAPQSIAADGDSVWVVSNEAPRSFLEQLDARTGQRLARVAIDGYASYVAVGAGGVWVADLHEGGLTRFDPRTSKPTTSVPTAPPDGIAANDRWVWVRAQATLTQRDADGRVLSRVGGLSPTLGDESQKTMLADAEGVWVVGSSDGLLYRIERGRVTKRITVGGTAGTIAGRGSTLWVTTSPGVDRYELVRVDADEGKVTGRVAIGRFAPQAIVPIGDDVWVVTGAGTLMRVATG